VERRSRVSDKKRAVLHILVGAFALAFIASVACAEQIKRSTQIEQPFDPFTAAQIDDQHPLYYQIIITYCPEPLETPLEPTNQGKSHDDDIPSTMEERKAALRGHGCLDVPVPMEYLLQEMTVNQPHNTQNWQKTAILCWSRESRSAVC
jgi:hypothetical protein